MKRVALILTIISVAFIGSARPPNIVYIMSDEIGYYEVGYMGQELIKTPRIDGMAKEGLVFTHAMAGAPVCAPLRCVLMTGKHMGHASVRVNDGGTPLHEGEVTIASALKKLGYATGGFGKWGAGGRGSTGVPEKHGFDVFFGYYDQVHAHSFYPPHLVRNSQDVPLKGNSGGRSGETYSHYEIMKEGLQFIREHKDGPFFAYFPVTPPHGMFDIPASDPAMKHYADKENWPVDARNYAGMVTMLDRNVGEILDLLQELGLERNTIVFFTGDNGGQDRFRTKDRPRGFFGPNKHPKTGVEFRGGKGNLYEGGLRIPAVVRWPGKIKSGQVSELLWYQPDIFPTLAELCGAEIPGDIDGLSILPTLIGRGSQRLHEMFYWEFREQTAVREKDWKAIQVKSGMPWVLYDLGKDVSETTDLADQHPEQLKRMIAFAKASHVPAKPGTFFSRVDHERDRAAKWGTSRKIPGRAQNSIKWPEEGLIGKSNVTVKSFSSESIHNGKLARNAIDGNPSTWWHSAFSVEHPHELVLDFGELFTVTGLRYLARQDNGWNGAVADAEIELSEDGKKWSAASVHTFKKQKTVQEVKIPETNARYLRFRALSEINGRPYATAAEIGVVAK